MRAFETFNEENDPYGEHDFGVLQIEGQKVKDLADPELTSRVLTLLLPEEF